MIARTLNLIVACLVSMSLMGVAATAASAAALPPRTALLYRINQARAKHHLAPVRPSTSLQRVASHHSDDMILRDYFAHTSPAGSGVYTRIVRSGFVSGYSWLGGETLAWGTGTLATPLATVHAWLNSPEHRAIVLSPQFRWVGISRACGTYQGHTGACVWTADWVKRW